MANVINNAPGTGNVLENATDQLSGIISKKPIAKYLSGARCILRMNGKIVGFAFGISWRITTDVTEIRTVDDYMPYELAPSIIKVEGSISGFRIPGQSPTVEGYQGDILSFLHQRYIEIEVRDSQSNNLIFATKRAFITGRSENVRADALAEMSLNFVAIGYADEKTPELPAGAAPNADGSYDSVSNNGTRKPLGRIVDKVRSFFG